MARCIQVRRGTILDWTTSNPVLAQGEIGFETDSYKFKIGNGSSTWSALSYFASGSAMTGDDIINAINSSSLLIDDNNLASTIARDSEVSGAISTHAASATVHHTNVNDPTSDEKAALVGTSGTPSTSNKFVTNADSRMTDARTPASHAHGNITNTGYIGSTATLPLITGASGIITVGSFGSAAGTFCQGNDARLSDSRTPLSHAHGSITNLGAIGSTSGVPIITGTSGVLQAGSFGSASGTFCAGDDSRLSNARTPTAHAHGSITDTGYLGSTANLPLITGTSGVITTGTFGTAVNTFCQGNDSRLSDSRTPVAHDNSLHTATYIAASGVTYSNLNTNGSVGTGSSQVAVGNHAHGNVTNTGYLGSTANIPLITGTSGIIQAGSFGTAANTFCVGNDARLSDARTPLTHAHGNITNTGYLGVTASIPLITGTAGIIQAGSFGSAAGTFCQGDDSRLSNARTPTAHAHGNITDVGAIGTTTGLPIITGASGVLTAGSFGTTSGTFCQGNDSRLSDARTPLSHVHGNITNTGYLGVTANIPLITGTAGIIQAGSFGTAANTFCVGNDSRLSDSRTPLSHVHGNITNAGAIGSTSGLPIITTASGVLTTGTFGSTSGTFCAGDDSRLSNARAPTSHASTHVTGGSDVIANAIAGGNSGLMSGADKTKLDGVEASATADMTGSEIVTAINGVASVIDDENIATTIARYSARPFTFNVSAAEWATGLSNVEIGRVQLQTGEVLYVQRVEMQLKGGGTAANLSCDVYNSTGASVVASTTAGSVNTTGGNSASAALILVRVSNSVGSTQTASIVISGWIR